MALDVRAVLPTISAPALVMFREHDSAYPGGEVRHAADLIPGARSVELPGNDHWITAEPQEPMFDAIRDFLEGLEGMTTGRERRLSTIVLTDIRRLDRALGRPR